MYNGTFKSEIAVNLSNVLGWRTLRRIVVFESDDWGSIRMSSNEAFNKLIKAGMREDRNHYNTYDSLESNSDLEFLFDILSKHKDKNENHAVFTGVNIMANPDFERIKESGYCDYYYESFDKTLSKYPQHNKVLQLWKEGIENRLIVPIFHGREHLNVQRWMRALRSGHRSTILAFENGVTGIYNGIDGEWIPNYQAAFDLDSSKDLPYMEEVIKSGLQLFKELFGFQSKYFVPTNGPFNNSLENTLCQAGVRFINSGKKQSEPLGEGRYKTNYRYLGMKNTYNQLYLTRNCFFEPSSFEKPANTDWIGNCLKEIEIAFKWHKPATISTHRVNYVGFLHPENREKSLKKLDQLLGEILKRWPDVEFMTSVELGDLIASKKA